MANASNLVIWQWNCASFRKRKAVLQQLLSSANERPSVILLQETLTDVIALRDYRAEAHFSEGKRGVAAFVSKNLAYLRHDVRPDLKVEHIMIELIPNDRLKQSVFILNVYSSPADRKETFNALFQKACKIAGNHPLIIAGDFNAQHQDWGYLKDTAKGKALAAQIAACGLTLVTDPRYPTRIGNSVSRDTTPDLTMVRNAEEPVWTNLQENLSSDHYISSLAIRVSSPPLRKFRVTDWDLFRNIRKQDETDYSSLEELFARLKEDVAASTKEVQTDKEVERMDSRLAHLLEAKNTLQAKWKTQKLNRRLRKRIAELNRKIDEHSQTLARQKWDEVCNAVDGQMRSGAKWNILKHLLGDKQSKANQRLTIDRLIHNLKNSGMTENQITDDLASRYLCIEPGSNSAYPPATHENGTDPLGSPFTCAEVREVLYELNCRSAPGPDGITNKLLKNLDDGAIELLTNSINEVWETGEVPLEWRVATVILIPKPGKPLEIGSLRPISLTSCVGKVAEHVILNRAIKFTEERNLLPFNQIGFRPSMSTQDVMILIKHKIIDKASRDTRAVLALDLEKAFDKVTHAHILDSIKEAGLGEKFYKYVSSFLKDRKATIRLGTLGSKTFDLGSRGTPQGAVLSPFLFNLSMRALSRNLAEIEGLGHAFYADDITVWCDRGSDGQIEEKLQTAIRVVQDFLNKAGLSLSAKKSELLLYRPTIGAKKGKPPDISITTENGSVIPVVQRVRILGMFLEEDGSNDYTLDRIATKADSMTKLITRVANKRGGLSEENLRRLFHAFLISHINYIALAHKWSRRDKARLESIIRKSIKKALGLPQNTSTERLLELGVHNTFDEIVEAQQVSQVARLASTEAGRQLLAYIGKGSSITRQRECALPVKVREMYSVSQIPRNMHPEHNYGRRKARARALLNLAAKIEDNVAFVDAAQYAASNHFVSVATSLRGELLTSLTLKYTNADKAEQVAVAIAMATTNRSTIFTDSRAATRAFMKGSVCKEAARVLSAASWTGKKHLIWFPGHMGSDAHEAVPNANELAHFQARGLTRRAGSGQSEAGGGQWQRDTLLTFNEVCKHYQLGRRKFPLPNPHLNRPQAITLRMLQTGTYPSPFIYSKFIEGIDPGCPRCGHPSCTLKHMLWQCLDLRGGSGSPSSEEDWLRLVTSSAKEEQLRAVQRAREIAERLNLPAPSWVRPADDVP